MVIKSFDFLQGKTLERVVLELNFINNYKCRNVFTARRVSEVQAPTRAAVKIKYQNNKEKSKS